MEPDPRVGIPARDGPGRNRNAQEEGHAAVSTLRRSSRLLNLWPALGPGLLLSLGLAGCSATSGPRTGAVSKMKTFLSVGDKPLPVVSGEPGTSLAADAGTDAAPPESRRRGRPDGRISGRVYDAEGRPVPEARVRLAVSGAPGGKVVNATTDRSGAFTLHGLRPGSDYTVIAEWDGGRGVETGRADAKTSDTDVRISLGTQDDPHATASTPGRVERVSDREPVNEPEDGSATPAPRARRASSVNEEDMPPAPEAEALDPAGSGSGSGSARSRAATVTRRGGRPADAWKRGRRDRVETANPPELPDEPRPPARDDAGAKAGGSVEPDAAPKDAQARGASAPAGEPAEFPDDGENPLPPALERVPGGAASADPGPRTPPDRPEREPLAAAPPGVAAGEPDPDLALLDAPSTPTRRIAASSAFESPTRPTGPDPAPTAADAAPGAIVVVPETFGPVVVHPSDPFAGFQPPAGPTPAPAPGRSRARAKPALLGSSTRSRPAGEATAEVREGATGGSVLGRRIIGRASLDLPPAGPRPSVAAEPPAETPASPPSPDGGGAEKRRPTWGQVVTAVSTPRDPAVTEAADRKTAEPARARRALAVRPEAPARPGRALKAVKTAFDKPECEYDDRLRQIIDFRLPDLNGNSVRFRDLDADLVLIDFWGTWCQPCLRSIPHLVNLQERMGARLAVVGVACESDSPRASSAKVTETVRRLNVNYPVLLSRNDGSCPLQEALHISAFPTMILVDRQGRVLWRDQGATPATLARLDRMLAPGPKGETRRY